MTQAGRFRAPREDGGLLAQPALASALDMLAENQAHLAAWDHDFQGRKADRLREMVRRELRERTRAFHERHGLGPPPALDEDGPLIVTGHQPEPFHPGVWVKNFAVAGLARKSGGMGLNLIVDNDLPKASSVRVPTLTPLGLRTVAVPFDSEGEDLPFEDLAQRDEAAFAQFPDEVRALMAGLVADPVLDVLWPEMLEASKQTSRVGLRWAVSRHRLEESWGVLNAEVPLSSVCETDGFLWFAAHVLAHLPRFQEVHNDALTRYRKAHGLRSRHHPVPALGREGDWLEAPFWVWRKDRPRRRPLMARQRGASLDLRIAGEDEVLLGLPLAGDREACCAVELLRGLPAAGVRLRTRALTTTMFARLLVADLFVHGIGGAKYDELGDEIVRAFFGFVPAGYLTLSLTAWLGLPELPATENELRQVARLVRDLEFNPDRHLAPRARKGLEGPLMERQAALDMPTTTHNERVDRFRAIRRANAALAPFLDAQRVSLETRKTALSAEIRQNALARGREYAFVLHSVARLRGLLMAHA